MPRTGFKNLMTLMLISAILLTPIVLGKVYIIEDQHGTDSTGDGQKYYWLDVTIVPTTVALTNVSAAPGLVYTKNVT